MARWMGEGGAREKGDTRGELRGEDAALSSALEKMKAVSVRLRWYLLKGLPGGKVCEEFRKRNPTSTNPFIRTLSCGPLNIYTLCVPVRDPGLVGLSDDDDDSCLKNSLGFMERWDTSAAASCTSSNRVTARAQKKEKLK